MFNKADTVDEHGMAGALAGLRHNLAKSMPTPEVPEVYVTSLDSETTLSLPSLNLSLGLVYLQTEHHPPTTHYSTSQGSE